MAAEIGMARTTLYKKLMAITGQGPAEFIRTIRIKRGRALLETSQMQITEIAYAVGFTTVKSFTMNFKSIYGITPSEFLRSDGSKQLVTRYEKDIDGKCRTICDSDSCNGTE
jgi:AraC-like DNA-binding protein